MTPEVENAFSAVRAEFGAESIARAEDERVTDADLTELVLDHGDPLPTGTDEDNTPRVADAIGGQSCSTPAKSPHSSPGSA
ncbi:hypothetical protein ACFWP7_00690 [Streptomyces sp. NPDC058470]|uniref:hypothetical protein n=1 Tax=Streptomyces sp. NPDC058470 TaxID=3346515 RepID=UPI0036564EDA